MRNGNSTASTLRMVKGPLSALAVLALLCNVLLFSAQAHASQIICAAGSAEVSQLLTGVDGQPIDNQMFGPDCEHCTPPDPRHSAVIPASDLFAPPIFCTAAVAFTRLESLQRTAQNAQVNGARAPPSV